MVVHTKDVDLMAESIENLNIAEVQERVQRAIDIFGQEERELLLPLGSEQNLAQRLARWLEEEFPTWNVDCEYNRIVDGTSQTARVKVANLLMKRVKKGFIHLNEPKETKVVPDIIIHQRGPGENLLAIEVKKSNNRAEIEFDFEKLRAYRDYPPLNYRFSLFIRFQELQENGEFVAEMVFSGQ